MRPALGPREPAARRPQSRSTSGISKAYGKHTVLDGVDLRVETGTVFSLLGPNGAGKTTLVRILSTLIPADAGSATICGHDLAGDPDAIRRVISLTGQYAAVDEVLTAEENIQMMARLRKLSPRAARERTDELLEEFDLAAARDRRAGTFSGGMTRRLDLAISMIERPALLFLDEPTTGLDPRSREQVWGTIRSLVDEGVTVLLTTQYLEEADQLADRIALLDGGRITAEGTSDELKASVGSDLVRIELADDRAFAHPCGVLKVERSDARLRTVDVATNGSATELRALLAHIEREELAIRRVSTIRPSLDDVFLTLTDRPAA